MPPAKSAVIAVVDKAQMQLDERGDMQQVLDRIQVVYQTLEPWANADSPHPKAKSALNLVKVEVNNFSASLNQSLDAAKLCHNCAENGIMILESLDNDRVTLEELRLETEITVQDVNKAKAKLSGVVDSLRNNRTGVLNARESLEAATKDIKDEKETKKFLEGKAKKKIQKICTGFKAAQVVSAVILVAASPACPPLIIAIPIILPLLELASHNLISHETKKIEKRSVELVHCTAAVDQIHNALQTLERLENSLDSLLFWWGQMEEVFLTIHNNLESIRKDIKRMRIKRLIQSFQEVKTEFLQYKLRIVKIQDYYSRDLK